MAIWLASLSLDLQRRRDRGSRERAREGEALLVVGQSRGREVVVRACERAARAGVREGMVLAQARALVPRGRVRVERRDAARERAGVRALAVWAGRFSPSVAVDAFSDPPDGLLADVTGCSHLFGGEGEMAARVVRDLASLGLRARAAIAGSYGCAWAVARCGEQAHGVVVPGGERAALAPLPVRALRVGEEIAAGLDDVGLGRIGDVLDLPRSTLAPRFGDDLLVQLDRALGRAIETIEPVRDAPAPEASRMFDGPTKDTGVIERTVRELLERVCRVLLERERGARSVEVVLHRSDLKPERLRVRLGRANRDVRHVWALLRHHVERAHMGFGVEGVVVRAPSTGVLRHDQLTSGALTGGGVRGEGADPHTGAREELLDVLRARLGETGVLYAHAAGSHVPERAFRTACGADAPVGAITRGDRPTVLFEPARAAEAVLLSPDGPVARVRWSLGEHEVRACAGPERIEGEWWRGEARGREYYRVQDADGVRLWVFRCLASGRWFVHGVWA
ncbi:MAG: DNA polymerase Y family protein [Planctomycetota bacterium]|nr:DNA polymerase Y family protein [Planctomycetota bacterium]